MTEVTEDDYRPALVRAHAARLIILSGCSGGGKSTLLAELGRRGYAVYEEAGRQVVKEQHLIGGTALPWADAAAFVELTISRTMHNMVMAARGRRTAFFDRGIVDQISGYEQHPGRPIPGHLLDAAEHFRANDTVFMVPPWPEIFRNDAERRHSLSQAEDAYATLLRGYERFGYRPVPVPKLDVRARADFVLRQLGFTLAAGCRSCE